MYKKLDNIHRSSSIENCFQIARRVRRFSLFCLLLCQGNMIYWQWEKVTQLKPQEGGGHRVVFRTEKSLKQVNNFQIIIISLKKTRTQSNRWIVA